MHIWPFIRQLVTTLLQNSIQVKWNLLLMTPYEATPEVPRNNIYMTSSFNDIQYAEAVEMMETR